MRLRGAVRGNERAPASGIGRPADVCRLKRALPLLHQPPTATPMAEQGQGPRVSTSTGRGAAFMRRKGRIRLILMIQALLLLALAVVFSGNPAPDSRDIQPRFWPASLPGNPFR